MADDLRFREDGTFTIVQLTDLHIGGDKDNEEDLRTLALVSALLAAEKPDLIVYTGDLISSYGVSDSSASFRRAIAPAVESGVPWTHVLGNHDAEADVTREELMLIALEHKTCYSQAGPLDLSGVGNYMHTIKSVQSGNPAAVLYFLDSGVMAPESVGGYAWIASDQVHWYKQQSLALRERSGAILPGLAFFHIPLPEYNDVWNLGKVSGTKHEEVCCPKLNSGLFAAMVEMGDMMGTFVGHDHDNDYCGTLHDIRLCFGRVTGCSTYGDLQRGARVIRLQEGRHSFETWQQLEDGGILR
ncbi:metallophosphoesterase family protein [Paenibacillus frigoriresistens]|uniref:metallophosphoesterase family protein n=1 Tax=Paenibacillus alginolyticus TaxID=59839 RepID=UPI00156695A2|nr:metallophosphoesterase family protein [Paenibacillus frigoriresistens]NRF91041.1 metallophosphoesterase family protein [Paenibacillus frigoriresistens]